LSLYIDMATTYEDVVTAAQQLRGAQQVVSVRSVRRVLGGGSPNVIHRHLREWKSSQLIPGTSETPAQMVAQLTEVAPRFWAMALEEARNQVRVETEQLRQSLAQATIHVDEVQGLLDESEALRAQALAEQQRAVTALETVTARFAAADGQIAQTTQQLAEAQSALHRQQVYTEHVTAKFEALEQRAESDRLRHHQELATRDDAMQGLFQESEQLKVQLDAAVDEVARLTADIGSAGVREAERNRHITALEVRASADRVLWEERLARLQADGDVARAAAARAESHVAPLQQALATFAQDAELLRAVREGVQTHLPGLVIQLTDRMSTLEQAVREAQTPAPIPPPDAPPSGRAP